MYKEIVASMVITAVTVSMFVAVAVCPTNTYILEALYIHQDGKFPFSPSIQNYSHMIKSSIELVSFTSCAVVQLIPA